MREETKVAIHGSNCGTRLLAIDEAERTILKARLLSEPRHRRALPALLEGLALWQGARVHAVLVADGSACGCGTGLYQAVLEDFESEPLYSLDYGLTGAHEDLHRGGDGLGKFADLKQYLLEVGR